MKIIQLTLINNEGIVYLNLENVVSFEVEDTGQVECIMLNGVTYLVEENIFSIVEAIQGI
jgi:hypothetical protein